MVKGLQVKKYLKWLTLLTYITCIVLIIVNNDTQKLTFLIPVILALFFMNFFRDYYLYANKKPVKYVAASIILEMLLTLTIGFFDKSAINILFFYVLLSSVVITYSFAYSIPLVLVFIISEFSIYAFIHNLSDNISSLLTMVFSLVVSSAFVMGMSYLVKMQVREKEKQARINAELEQAYRKLIEQSALAQKLTIEEERTRMAREIHDTLAHTLTTLIVQLEVCKKLSTADPSRLPGELEKAQELSRSGFNDIKRSIKALRPQVMEDKTFLASITAIINETKDNANVHITLDNFLPNDMSLTSQVEIALFRAIQESITNSIRHGQAAEIQITLKYENYELNLIIEDNGLGCNSIKKGFGTKGIRERIGSLNGSVEYISTYGKGFKTVISVPVEAA